MLNLLVAVALILMLFFFQLHSKLPQQRSASKERSCISNHVLGRLLKSLKGRQGNWWSYLEVDAVVLQEV